MRRSSSDKRSVEDRRRSIIFWLLGTIRSSFLKVHTSAAELTGLRLASSESGPQVFQICLFSARRTRMYLKSSSRELGVRVLLDRRRSSSCWPFIFLSVSVGKEDGS